MLFDAGEFGEEGEVAFGFLAPGEGLSDGDLREGGVGGGLLAGGEERVFAGLGDVDRAFNDGDE